MAPNGVARSVAKRQPQIPPLAAGTGTGTGTPGWVGGYQEGRAHLLLQPGVEVRHVPLERVPAGPPRRSLEEKIQSSE